jgi:hypothetical protein
VIGGKVTQVRRDGSVLRRNILDRSKCKLSAIVIPPNAMSVLIPDLPAVVHCLDHQRELVSKTNRIEQRCPKVSGFIYAPRLASGTEHGTQHGVRVLANRVDTMHQVYFQIGVSGEHLSD